MTRYYLTRLVIEGFRGINNEGDPLDLRFKTDAVNSVFAPNALGKSSAFEALCFALDGVVPKLEQLPAAEDAGDYYCNRFHSGGHATIDLTLEPDDASGEIRVVVERDNGGNRHVQSPTGHPDPEVLLSSLSSDLVLLDHKTFLEFVEESPLKRGRAFSSLLGLSRLSEMRQALSVLAHAGNLNSDFEIDTLKAELRSLRLRVEEEIRAGQDNYRKLVGAQPDDPFDLDSMARGILGALTEVPLLTEFFENKKLADVDFKAVKVAIRKEEQGDKRAHLTELSRSVAELEKLAPSEDSADQQEQLTSLTRSRQEALAQTLGQNFERLYLILRDILKSPEWPDDLKCPACDSTLQGSLATATDAKLAAFEVARSAQAALRTYWSNATWVARLRALEEDARLGIDASARRFPSLDRTFRMGEPTDSDVQAAIQLAEDLEGKRTTALHDLEEEKVALEKDLPPSLVKLSEQIGRAELFSSASADLESIKERLGRVSDQLAARQKWVDFIRGAASDFAKAEVALSTKQTAALEVEYRQMYSEITKNPDIVPRLRKTDGSEDLYLRLEAFYGLSDLSANTLLSESYRNALALSIYLSAALQRKGSARFLVLDDVTSSFDAGHQFHLMELIRTAVALPSNQEGLQVVMLSHDGLLEKYFDRLSSTTAWHHTRLRGLPPTGMIFTQAQEGARIRDSADGFLDAGQTTQAVPLVRQYLEFRLLEVIRKVRIRVPLDFSIRDDRKMVQNCLDAITAAVQLHKDAGNLVLEPSDVTGLTNVHLPALVSNWISHYATGVAASWSPYALKGVLDTIDRFAACFRYECSCQGATKERYYKSLATKACTC